MKIKDKILITVAMVILAMIIAVCFFSPFSTKDEGKITIEVRDLNNGLIKDKDVYYKEDDDLFSLIEKNFDNVRYDDGMIMDIETIKTPADWSSFIAIYVNEQSSVCGLSDIVFKNGDVISFRETAFVDNYESEN